MHRQILAYDPIIGYIFVPNLKARVPTEEGGYLIRSNGQGFRDDKDFVRARAQGKKRVLLFGDSFTAGDGVSNGLRYSDELERLIPGCEVFNFGMPGTGTDQHYLIYRQYAREIERDAVIVAVLVENIRRVASRYRHYFDSRGNLLCYAKPYFQLDGGRLVLKNTPVPKHAIAESEIPENEKMFVDRGGRYPALRKLVAKAGLKDLLQRVTRYQPLPEYDDARSEPWQLMKAILKIWFGEIGPSALLVPIPLYQHVEGSSSTRAYQARFRELSSEVGCRLFDPLDGLRSYSYRDRRAFRFRHDVHPTRSGHEALARCLKPTVEELIGASRG